MKLRKSISRFLTVGIMLNNIYFNTNASNVDIPNRYETLEGEYIVIEDSMEGEFHEIEIFGNTVQDPDNLEDIQSVGELYIDENGEPILDKKGREQYKIDITSINNNLFNIENINISNTRGQTISKLDDGNLGYKVEFSDIRDGTSKLDFEFINGYSYTVSLDIRRAVDNEHPYARVLNIVAEGDPSHAGLKYITLPSESSEWTRYNLTFSIPLDGRKYSLWLNGNNHYTGVTGFVEFKNIQIEQGLTQTQYSFHQNNKVTILLPCQLQKVGDIADKLYWDSEKGRYVIEKNVKKVTLDGSKNWGAINLNTNNVTPNNVFSETNAIFSDRKGVYICNWNKGNADLWGKPQFDNMTMVFLKSNGQMQAFVKKSDLSELTLNGFKKYINLNNIVVLYCTTVAQLIETNITEKILLPIYADKTHIYVNSENRINPTLKVTIDKLPQISRDAVEEAEVNSTSSNIALARLYVNMLPESLYKDQLQEQLNQLFSSDMVLERQSVTANLDVYIKSENMLSISLDTNSVSFDGYSGTELMEKLGAVNITINSSLPYSLNAYMPNEIQNNDGNKKIDLSVFKIRENNEGEYKQFANTVDKLVLKDSCPKGNNINHAIDLKLDSSDAHKADVYKTTIKFEVEQK